MADEERYQLGYARVSTGEQNLQLQIDALIAAGVKPDDIFTDVASGGSMKRPGLVKMQKAIREGDVLVVWKLDRLSRRLEDVLHLAAFLAERKADLKSLTQALDTTNPTGRLIFHVFAVLADFEREVGVERTKAGLAAAKARGRVGGRRVTLTDDIKEAVMQSLAEGLTVKETAERHNVSRSMIYKWRGGA